MLEKIYPDVSEYYDMEVDYIRDDPIDGRTKRVMTVDSYTGELCDDVH